MQNIGNLYCEALHLLSPSRKLTFSFRYPPHQLVTASKHTASSPAATKPLVSKTRLDLKPRRVHLPIPS